MLGSLGNPHEAMEMHPPSPSVHPYCLSNFGGSHALSLLVSLFNPLPPLPLFSRHPDRPMPTVKAALAGLDTRPESIKVYRPICFFSD